ncbi:hypothetical protein ONA91_25925 [Micromonospora sp. DR5-3]|uniref:hypothetical protein n=1 Tax=unclassified Micromonospora TaxID=2617518 RepID=UPI002102C39A|nr:MULTISPECIES: hypothetical protein [unclassified Micromonospora]MCW3817893.1 hypothetical protein [Micromonospora sp. DR5-3]
MRKRLRAMLGLAVAGVLAVPVAVLGVHVTHPRDEDEYLAHLKQYGDLQSDRPLEVLPPTADLIAEGDAACDWLREQPYALWRHDPDYRESAVFARYLRNLGDRSPKWGDALPGLGSVAGAAWGYLCPADWELRQPRRHPFTPKPD